MMSNQSITYFLFEETAQSLTENKSFNEILNQFTDGGSHQDWQQHLCLTLNYHQSEIPWNLLRALEIDLLKDAKTIVCCDPISIQMTHRGAYCWGQAALSMSTEDAQTIVSQINQLLMRDGEQFLLTDDLQWLYICNEQLELNQSSFVHLIGKDLFDFRYQGKDERRWSRLATEIQMLIKQLMDYKKIEACSPEASVAVHFWGDTRVNFENAFLTHESDKTDEHEANIIVYSSDQKLNKFVQKNKAIVKEFSEISELANNAEQEKALSGENEIIIITNSMSSSLTEMIKNQLQINQPIKIVVQDKIFLKKTKMGNSIFNRIFEKLFSNLNFGRAK